jgi:long-chain acyl-CoA synthetase
VCVPLYETLGEDAIEYILGHSEARLVVVQGKRLGRVAKALAAVQGSQVGGARGPVVGWRGGRDAAPRREAGPVRLMPGIGLKARSACSC